MDTGSQSSKTKNLVKLLIKVTITLGMLVYVISLVDKDELLPLLAKVNPLYLILALTAHLVAFIVMSGRWWLILIYSGEQIRYKHVLPAYYLGLFCNNFLPTSMGGDVVRIAKLKSEGLNFQQLIFSTLADRVIGLISIIIMGILGINFSISIRNNIDDQSLVFINIASTIAILLFLAAFNARLRSWILANLVQKLIPWTKINNFLVYCHQNLSVLIANRIMPVSILLSLVSQLLIVVTYYLISLSLGVNLSFLDYVLVVPVIALVSSLPITVGGLGLREGALVFLLGTIGVSTALGVSISLLYLSVLIFVTLPGGILLVVSPTVKPSTS